MPNYPIHSSRRNDISDIITKQATDRANKWLAFNTPAFPLARIEELLNPPAIMRAVTELRTLDFARFKHEVHIGLMLDNVGADRAMQVDLKFPDKHPIISSRGDGQTYGGAPWSSASKTGLRLDLARMTENEIGALREWTNKVCKARREQRLIVTTIESAMKVLDNTYQVVSSWPLLATLVPTHDEYHRSIAAKFSDKPRSPEVYNVFGTSDPVHIEMRRRIDAVDILLLKAGLAPAVPEHKINIKPQQWQAKKGDPEWLTYGP